ncbi:MAG: hypothetical protein FJ303_11050 [Planctomycetes bacterium]|nr:hypothetical protein [Planctomycetota bacterium]
MNRTLLILLVLVLGAAVGGGGVYVALNWDKFNPFQKPDLQYSAKAAAVQLRKTCAGNPACAGVMIAGAEIANGKLSLHGLVARKEQIALIEAKARALIEESSDLRSQCSGGPATDGLSIVPVQDKLATLFQPPEANSVADRQLLRMTRLDAATFDEDGRLRFTGVCIRGKSDPKASDGMLASLLKARLQALGAAPKSVPEIAVDVQHHANPAGTLQARLNEVPAAKGVHVTAAWYDDKSSLHVAAVLPRADQQGVVEQALAAFAKDVGVIVAKPGASDAKITPNFVVFDGASRGPELQKRWVEHARKENKSYLRHVLIQQVAPATIENDKKQVIADDEGNTIHFFKVTGRLFDTAGERGLIEKELSTWLTAQLPTVLSATFEPIKPYLAFDVRENPIFALQERVVQRGLDGAAFTDALFDEKGSLDLVGRLHRPDAKGAQEFSGLLAEVFSKEPLVNLSAVVAHESKQVGQAIAWSDVVKQTQTQLAADKPLGERIRVDRLYYTYEDHHLRLACEGAFLHDGATANLDSVVSAAVDAVTSTRGTAALRTTSLKRVRNPLTDLQNAVSDLPMLDGALFTDVRYGADGQLHVEGYLGQADQQATLTPILTKRLESVANLLKPGSDPKGIPGWSAAGMKVHTGKIGFRWIDLVRTGQADLATASEAFMRRTHFGRAYFKYAEPRLGDKDTRRKLVLHANVLYLAKPSQSAQDVACKTRIEQKLADLGKRFLADVGMDRFQVHVNEIESPVLDWQKHALAKDWDGVLFREASFDRQGKLTIDGYYGSSDQFRHAKLMIDQHLGSVDNKALAPDGSAPLDSMTLVSWQPLLDDVQLQFSQAKTSLHKQTRIDRAYFQFDKSTGKPMLHVKGICIYHGTVMSPAQQTAALIEKLKGPLKAKGVDNIDIDLAGITQAGNPLVELQKRASAGSLDGVLFAEIGFDAKRTCYLRVVNIPEGKEKMIRQYIDEAATKHEHLKAIQLR